MVGVYESNDIADPDLPSITMASLSGPNGTTADLTVGEEIISSNGSVAVVIEITNSSKIGNTNHGAAFSFYANKNITTGGEGGALATNDRKFAEKVKRLSNKLLFILFPLINISSLDKTFLNFL